MEVYSNGSAFSKDKIKQLIKSWLTEKQILHTLMRTKILLI